MFLLAGRSEDTVMALINQQNPDLPVELPVGSLYFGKPRKLTTGVNAVAVPTTGEYDSGYEDYVTFNWERIDLAAAFGTIRPVIRDLGQSSLYRLLPSINKALGTDFRAEDLYDVEISWVSANEQLNIPLRALPTSLGYVNQFIVQYIRKPANLDDNITHSLRVMRHPSDPTLGKGSVDMLTWGIDFTDYAAKELANNGNYYSDTVALKALMAQFGFADWPTPQAAGQLDNRSTKDVPGANTAFTNVLIQKLVVGDTYAGTAYFHYNRT